MQKANTKVWLIGAGGMALDYAKVLDALELDYSVIGRGEKSASKFESLSHARVIRGGLENRQRGSTVPDCAIIAVGVEALGPVTCRALEHGIRRILVEKPAGLNLEEVSRVNELALAFGAEIYVAYNRRFYGSVLTAQKIIRDDGGVSSFAFEFTEFSHEIETLKKAPGVKEAWVLGNSSHVLDLAFHLGGVPEDIYAVRTGGLSWHPSGSVFAGAGRVRGGALFSYHANWESAGRWGLELCTPKRRLIFRPMEQLQVMPKGSVSVEAVDIIDADIDKKFKPGLIKQVEAFIFGNGRNELCGISEHLERLPIYVRIAGY